MSKVSFAVELGDIEIDRRGGGRRGWSGLRAGSAGTLEGRREISWWQRWSRRGCAYLVAIRANGSGARSGWLGPTPWISVAVTRPPHALRPPTAPPVSEEQPLFPPPPADKRADRRARARKSRLAKRRLLGLAPTDRRKLLQLHG